MSSKMKILEQVDKVAQMRVPMLRFPEFHDSGNWDKTALNKLFTIGSGKDYKHLSTGDIPVYGSGGYMLSVNDYLYDGESVCIGRKGTIDKPIFLTGKFWTVDTLFYTHSFIKCLPKFIFYQFQKINWKNYNEAGGIPSLSKTTIGKIEILVPSFAEQKKIADFLSSLDNIISLQTQKIDTLQQYKKGLMQKLFPADGEKMPGLRFSEFKNEGHWEERNLNDIAVFYKGKGISKSDIVQDGRTLCIRYGELYTHYNETINSIISKTDIPESELFLSRKNDVIIPSSGETKWDIATASCVMLDKVALGGDLNIIRTNENGVFISYYLNSAKRYDISKIAQGDTVVHLYSSQLKLLNLLLPPKREEQQKIAGCLSSLDELINTEIQKLTFLKNHKTGLMQQLFPEMDKVNA